MADYQLTQTDMILRVADGANIPPDPANTDYAEYQQWVEDGGVADPYIEPRLPPPQMTAQQLVMFDHENRLRRIEGAPLLTPRAFMSKV